MHPVNVIIIFVIVGLTYVVLPIMQGHKAVSVSPQKGGHHKLELNFSEITDDISTGNNASWSNKKNISGPHHASRPEYTEQKFTFWGHGVPLAHETKLGKQYGQKIPTLSGMNLKCSPDCCPSPYSCDGGCVCYHRDRKGGKLGGPTLRKDFTNSTQIR